MSSSTPSNDSYLAATCNTEGGEYHNGAGAKFIRSNKKHKAIYLPETSRDTRVVTWDDL